LVSHRGELLICETARGDGIPSLAERPDTPYTPPRFRGALHMAFKCVVVTPEQQMFDETITQAIVPAHDGQVGILTDRAPLLVKLGAGELRLDLAGGQSRRFTIKGGIAQMKDNVLTILTNEAAAPEAAAR
jgi:F-type H+-transporting ATPase subunit epsilon